jgi:hypothetical protein
VALPFLAWWLTLTGSWLPCWEDTQVAPWKSPHSRNQGLLLTAMQATNPEVKEPSSPG